MEILFLGLASFGSFVVGAVVGVNNSATVTSAIAVLKQAEQKAQATLAQITEHKNT